MNFPAFYHKGEKGHETGHAPPYSAREAPTISGFLESLKRGVRQGPPPARKLQFPIHRKNARMLPESKKPVKKWQIGGKNREIQDF